MQDQVQRLDNLYRDELPERVAPLIRNLLAQGTASLDVIAQRLAMSPRTLQRSLNAEGTSFLKLLDETRRSLAEQYLRESQLQVNQLAELLGYAQVTSFTTAFGRWFGCSPTKWRQARQLVPRRLIRRIQN